MLKSLMHIIRTASAQHGFYAVYLIENIGPHHAQHSMYINITAPPAASGDFTLAQTFAGGRF